MLRTVRFLDRTKHEVVLFEPMILKFVPNLSSDTPNFVAITQKNWF